MLQIKVPTVQQQFGSCDSGIFAIAFTLHLAMGDDPQHILFEHSYMRSQKKDGTISTQDGRFRIQTENAPFFPVVTLDFFCTCHMPETYDDMVECEE